ncbi:MAG: D-alanine--D-alanine ligase family protein [Planctomycetota bacterium]|jgi:D-alanine-D-alanine ligase
MTIESSANSHSTKIEGRLKVAVLMGGIGGERDVSIQSGTCVAEALKKAGLEVVTADISPDNMDILEDSSIDIFFIALHGKFGEDGQLQQILEDKSLLYTGSGPAASKLAFDKIESKKAFVKAGVVTPKSITFDEKTSTEQLETELSQFGDRLVVKPVRQGSTIGVTIADNPKSALADAHRCLDDFGDCMIEEYTAGREITVGILQGRALPIIEIKSKTGFYDYEAKYIDTQTEFLFDTIEEPALVDKISSAAIDCFDALGCRHFARADFILADDGTPYVLEVNTIPGFTTHSLLPMAAAKTGLSMSELCTKIIEAAYSPLVKRKA